jgi:hypothetical protein
MLASVAFAQVPHEPVTTPQQAQSARAGKDAEPSNSVRSVGTDVVNPTAATATPKANAEPVSATDVLPGTFGATTAQPQGSYGFPGSVGIGATNPEGLQIGAPVNETTRGVDNVRAGVLAGTPRLMLEDGASPTLWQIDNYNGDLRFFTPGSARLFIQGSTGAVGIGTTTPGTDGYYTVPLTVHSTGQLGSFIKISNADPTYGMGGVWLPKETLTAGWLFGTDNGGNALIRYGASSSETGAISSAKDGAAGLAIDTAGNVGIGTATPGVAGSQYAVPLTVHNTGQYGSFIKISNRDPTWGMGGVWLPNHTFTGGWLFGTDNGGKALIRYGSSTNEQGAMTTAKDGTVGLAIDTAGNVGIGTSTPNFKLEVVGNANFTGTVTGGNIQAKYQDVAEWVPAANDLSPGTVVILDTTTANQVTAARGSYDTRVAGVVSAQPGLILGEAADSKEMIATTGRVKVRVDATTHPIAIGDLLVTSDKTGLAMKSVPFQMNGRSFHQPGTIIGKALEPLASGEGEILVLLSLQ